MTIPEAAQLLQGLGVLIAAVGSIGGWVSNCVLGKRNGRKIDQGTAVSTRNSKKIDSVHASTSIRMDELIAITVEKKCEEDGKS